MTTDVNSTEIAAVVSVGQKAKGNDMGGVIRRVKFSAVVLGAAAETGQISNLLPPGSEVVGIDMFNDNAGAGTVNVGLSGGTATSLATGIDPVAAGVSTLINNVAAGSNEIYLTAVGAEVTVSGSVFYTASA